MCVCICIYTYIYIYTQRASAACSCSCIANPRAHSYVHTQCAAATQGKAFGFHMYMNRGEIKDIAGKIGCAYACICKQALALGNGLPECTAGTRSKSCSHTPTTGAVNGRSHAKLVLRAL